MTLTRCQRSSGGVEMLLRGTAVCSLRFSIAARSCINTAAGATSCVCAKLQRIERSARNFKEERTMLRIFWLGVALLLLSACRPMDVLTPTTTTIRVTQATLPASAARDLHAIAAQTTPQSTAEAETCEVSAALPTTQHTVSADISYEKHQAVVQQYIHTINRGSDSLTDVALDVEANRFP